MNIPFSGVLSRSNGWRFLLLASVVCFSGCSSVFFGPATENLSETAGDLSNKQVLLNLARESQSEPAYFVQLGGISGSLTVSSQVGLPSSATVTLNHASSPGVANPQNTIALGAGLQTTLTENPTFTLTPLSGEQFTKTIVTPMPGGVFAALFEQGWYVDVLTRAMVSYIEKDTSTPDTADPTKGIIKTVIWNNSPNEPSYDKFLEFCCELKVAFKNDLITAITDDAGGGSAQDKGPPKAKKGSLEYASPTLKEAIAARQANCVLTQKVSAIHPPNLVYVMESKPTKYLQIEKRSGAVISACQYPVLAEILNNGSIFLGPDYPKPEPGQTFVCFHLASFESALYAMSQEPARFQKKYPSGCTTEIKHADNTVETFNIYPLLAFSNYIPAKDTLLVDIKHNQHRYLIGEIDGRIGPDDSRSPTSPNLEVFTLLVYLFNQAAIDSTKLAIPQFIQVQ
jgi:hypothetical protein